MKIKTGKMLVFSLCLCLFTMFLGTYIYATTGKVTAETVRLREEASTDSDTVLLIAEDAEVEILEEDGEWYKVEYTEGSTTYTGYIRQDMLDVEEDSEEAEKDSTEEETEETSDSQDEETQNEEETSSEETENETESQAEEVEEVEEETSQIEEQTEITLLDDVKIRILPLINASTIGTIKADTEVFVTEIIGNWAYIESDSNSGWVLTSKLEIEEETSKEETSEDEEEETETEEEEEEEETEEETAETKELYVNVTTVNLREEASSSSDILTQLALNTKVTLIEEVDDTWSKVTVSGVTGYIASEYLSETETEETTTSRGSDETRTSSSSDDDDEEETTTETSSSESSSSESTSSSSSVTGSDIVAYAKTLLGCKYVYGGTSPSGFDCSGFTQYVYAHFGYTIGRTSSSQRSDGTYVSKSNLQAGDLVCFSGHVGIYISNNQFIHAENASNGVTISSLTEAYYSKTYVTARRIID